jgi:RNA polymerase sigma factor (sigma-70 family)
VIPLVVLSQSQTHVTLLERLASQGDSARSGAAWAEFLDRYGDLIRGFCRRHDLQASDQDDVVQDVLVALSKAMPGFRYDPTQGKFRSYLKTVALHVIYAKLCQKRAGAALVDADAMADTAAGDPATDAKWEQEWRQHHIRQAMRVIEAEFSARDRAAFARYAIAGESADRVAQEHGLSPEALYQIKSRITRRLTELLARQVAEEG